MSANNFYLFYQRYGFNPNDVVIHYDFNTPHVGYVENVAPNNINQNGLIRMYKPEFWMFPESGNFSCGSYVEVDKQNFVGYDSQNLTMLIACERDIRTGYYPREAATNATIFSSISSGFSGIASGFAFGMTSTNALFFKAYDVSGNKYFWTSDKQYSNRNILALSKFGNNFNFMVYDTGSYSFIAENYYLQFNLQNSADFTIGKPYDTGQVGGFDGTMDEFIFIKNYFTLPGLSYIASGFFTAYTPPFQSGIQTTTTGITGYGTQTVTGFTVTGYQSTFTGMDIDDCGVSYSGFSMTPLTGTNVTTINIPLSGLLTYFTTVTTGEAYILDSGYLSGIEAGELSAYTGFNGFSGFDAFDLVFNNYDSYFNLG